MEEGGGKGREERNGEEKGWGGRTKTNIYEDMKAAVARSDTVGGRGDGDGAIIVAVPFHTTTSQNLFTQQPARTDN